MVATPTVDGKVDGHYLVSLVDSMRAAMARGHTVYLQIEPFCVYLPMVRSKLVQKFLDSNADDLFFIDSDQGWDPQAFVRLIERSQEIVGGVPPLKSDSQAFPCLLHTDANGFPLVDAESGLLNAMVLGTGFLRIRREAVNRYLDHYGREALAVVERNPDGSERQRYYGIFDTRKDGETWYGEDVWFGNQWRALGGDLWIDPDIHFTHTGTRTWSGNFHDYLRALPGGGGEPAADWQFQPRT